MLRPKTRGDAGENRHNLIKKNPSAKPRGLSSTPNSSDASLGALPNLRATLPSASSALGLGLQPIQLEPKTQAKAGPKLQRRSYPNLIQSLFPFFTSKLELHSTTNPSKKQTKRINNVNRI